MNEENEEEGERGKGGSDMLFISVSVDCKGEGRLVDGCAGITVRGNWLCISRCEAMGSLLSPCMKGAG